MGTGFREFFKPLEVGFSPYLVFYSHLSVVLMFRLVWGCERPFDRSQNVGPNCWKFLGFSLLAVSVQSHVGAIWVDYVLIYVLICALICIGPVMAEKSGFTK